MHSRAVEADVLALIPPHRAARALARLLAAVVGVVALALALVPWQQTSPGRGRVIAYAPVERQQTIDSQLSALRLWA